MLKKRVLSALIAIPLLIFIFRWGGLPFLALNLAVITLGLQEYFNLINQKGATPNQALALIVGWLVIIANYFELSAFILNAILVLGFVVLLLYQLPDYNDQKSPLLSVSTTMLGIFYVVVLFSYLLKLYFLKTDGHQVGSLLVWLPILATWMTDTGAYFTGLSLGTTPLAPKISPNKTVEGAVGGITGSVLITLIFSNFVLFSALEAVGLGILIGITAQLGDLCASAFKRDAQIKDTGDLIPGHGGILDRVDSLLFTLPIVYYYLVFIVL